jgi:murein DD-endopeptidase MepM/ murein hydrolase activator NlpD
MMQRLFAMLMFFCVSLSHAGEQFPVVWQGQFIQGGVVVGQLDPQQVVAFKLNERELPISAQGQVVFGFDRDAKSGDVLGLRMADGRELTQVLEVQPREYQIQRIEGISKRIMNPVKQDLARIGKESQMVTVARKQQLLRSEFSQTFVWPAIGPITGVFGSQRVYNGQPRRPHYGVDVAGPIGAPVHAPAGGKVTLAHPDMFYSGGTVIVDHGHGLSSSFLHLSKLHVKVGDEVKQGQLIAEIGASGRVTGAHLDWRMNWFDRRVDAQLLVPAMKELTEASGQ